MSFEGLYQTGITKQIVAANLAQHQATLQDLVDVNQAQADRIRQLEVLLAKTQGRLVEVSLEKEGYKVQAVALREALSKQNQNNELFKKTGKKYQDGRLQTNLSALFDKGVDAEAGRLGILNVGAYRQIAK